MAKGEGWCKRAIWGNTLPAVKREWKSVGSPHLGRVRAMWRDRVDTFYARYPAANVNAAAAGSLRSEQFVTAHTRTPVTTHRFVGKLCRHSLGVESPDAGERVAFAQRPGGCSAPGRD